MTEREYCLVQTATATKAVGDIMRGIIPMRGVATERELRLITRTAMRINMRAHNAMSKAGGCSK